PDLPQLLMMAAALQPAGHLVGLDVHPGQRADDPCYLPLIERVRQTLGEPGLLWVGDCKMAALGIRAAIVAHGDYYLMPLPRSGEGARCVAAWGERMLAGDEPGGVLWGGDRLPGAGGGVGRGRTALLGQPPGGGPAADG